MTPDTSDELVFIEDDSLQSATPHHQAHWRILIVDDDKDVHEATEFALAGIRILGRPLQLLHAHSGDEALELLSREHDVAVILLDVVMESDDAGLKTVDTIRTNLALANTRIILRTGQPGQAPEAETIARYDINDYKTKSELSQNKLFTTLTAAIRSYDQLLRLDASRLGLEKIVTASNQFIAEQGMQSFAEGVITQIASLIGVSPDGLVCAIAEESDQVGGAPEFRIIAAAGHFSQLIRQRLTEIDQPHIVASLTQALKEKRSTLAERNITLYFRKGADEGFAAFIDSAKPICEVDKHLLEVFCTNIALCAKNVDLVSELRRDAFFDRLTGLSNRTALILRLNDCLKNETPEQALAVIDIDQFASTNDVLGHKYGDDLLKAVSRRLDSWFGPKFCIARISGDTFGVLGRAEQIHAQNIQQCFSQPFNIEGVEHPTSVSTGITTVIGNPGSGVEALKDAYIALRLAKTQGLGQSITFSPTIGSESRERAQLLRDLRLGFDNQQLFLTFQPQVDLLSGAPLGVEALLRWRQADGTLIPPDRFIPIAEQSGLIVSMGSWLLKIALNSLSHFRATGFPALKMAVNISPIQLRQADFFEIIQDALISTNTPPENLELEITESVAVGGLDAIIPLLAKFRAQGIGIAIDDFGTGYSSLSYLERLPADHLKIDRCFVNALSTNSNGARIARTIVLLGHELGMRIIAEGVEDAETANQLLEMGCNEGQGYFYGRPMPEADMLIWLEQFKAKQ